MLEFRVLGPVEVWRAGEPVELSGRKMRAMLTTLLLSANKVVVTERLVAMLWGEQPPPTAVAQLHKYVSQLRTKLGPDCVVRHGAGYQLRIGQNTLTCCTPGRTPSPPGSPTGTGWPACGPASDPPCCSSPRGWRYSSPGCSSSAGC
ncbi:AfsR/SARP family transcriptional regulator [Micromonospora sp. DT229]|uniref:AfsR/SARP family transcriptional regulator n=1 Tax=Micromonospora sp. DT229 TaxID=3393430 RepID=UPI003CF71D4A